MLTCCLVTADVCWTDAQSEAAEAELSSVPPLVDLVMMAGWRWDLEEG